MKERAVRAGSAPGSETHQVKTTSGLLVSSPGVVGSVMASGATSTAAPSGESAPVTWALPGSATTAHLAPALCVLSSTAWTSVQSTL